MSEISNEATSEMLNIAEEIERYAEQVRTEAAEFRTDDGGEAERLSTWADRMRQVLSTQGPGKRRRTGS
jgi:hypothetical protein